ncbi:DUF2798 domain-containing protein [Echinimonas agarilytica]|uniref:DUF2798 domain-containing protein n=1 Tax=Echinimonas agarilytica TaxID=1215918 RepID=A0AA42B8K0_9GAMM|nr:DUF2798 domain-containing protein [Echinimonas agarilytica]MCM2680306.1 DUF2798 domain-containing protein [Echinimonas agarilytica]
MTSQVTLATPLPAQTRTPLIYKVLLMMILMMLIGGTLTGIMTYMNVGLTNTFYADWVSSFITAALFLMPAGLVLMTLFTKLAHRVLPHASETQKNVLVGLAMAIHMELIMAFATAANNIGFTDMAVFSQAWLKGFVVALPFALTMMMMMTLTIKPKIERFLKS